MTATFVKKLGAYIMSAKASRKAGSTSSSDGSSSMRGDAKSAFERSPGDSDEEGDEGEDLEPAASSILRKKMYIHLAAPLRPFLGKHRATIFDTHVPPELLESTPPIPWVRCLFCLHCS